MSGIAAVAEIAATPAVVVSEAPGVETSGGESEVFDRDAAMREAFNDNSTPEPAVEAQTKTDEQLTEEQLEQQRSDTRRKKLSDDEGKLSQDKLDGAFAKLTAEGRRHKARLAEFNTQKTQFETAKAQYDAAVNAAAERVTAQEKEFADLKEQAKSSPLGVLEKLGWDVKRLVSFIQNDGKHTPETQIEDTRREYDQRIAAQQKKLEELENGIRERSFKSAAADYQTKATKQITELMPKYPLAGTYDLATEIVPKVLQNITHIYREGGELGGVKYPKGTALDPKAVLDHFEAQEAKALARHGFRPGQAGTAASAAQPGAVQPKTLSNKDTSSRAVKPPSEDEEFDREAALAEVQRLFNG